MANIMDYIDWRGDLSMLQSPFNEVDNLILSHLSYVNFHDIVPPLDSKDSITIKDAAQLFYSKYDEEEIMAQLSLTKMSAMLLKRVGECERFAHLRLSKYVNIIDNVQQKQFSAITILLDDDTVYVAFRGTDNTIVGWKENFNMTFMSPVPAQLEAVAYLEAAFEGTENRIRVGGHSKGGNLAVYAAIKCNSSIKNRIIEVFNNDGPGFHHDIIDSIDYKKMLDRIKTIVPQSSIVGMMLEHEEEYIIVKSSEKTLLQHDPLAWEVLGNEFVCVTHITKESRLLDATLKDWLDKMTEAERSQFVDALFLIFETMNVEKLEDLTQEKWKRMIEIIKAVNNMEPENKKVLTKTIKLLFNEGIRVYKEAKTEVTKIPT
ncbi:DUF2974 domain-containing protein [Evansella sp. AB-P1]|uniref:DUF2974 domain-containing protein n=1 Tax=Evansella sp. AB-P1 TaxID=3037653 RepID=UPI00241BF85B|nr:Mbeg1-like protein [Evansella sp. AB-P1]MDG5788580.1 DUF2974 domain-containing protein [Evansella sp. AB-P1]